MPCTQARSRHSPARGESCDPICRRHQRRNSRPSRSLTFSAECAQGCGPEGRGEKGEGQEPALGHFLCRGAPGARSDGAPHRLPGAFFWCVFYRLLHLSHFQQEERVCRGLTHSKSPAQGAQTGACPIERDALTGHGTPRTSCTHRPRKIKYSCSS